EDLASGMDQKHESVLEARVTALAMVLRRQAQWLPADPDAQSRIDRASLMLGKEDNTVEALGRAASAAVAESLARHVTPPSTSLHAAVEHDQVVWATAPARLDFAGGWSDTPPICNDWGGTVINAAVTLNGQYPIQAIAKLGDDPVVTLTSIDLGQRVVFDRVEQLLDYADPSHWDALPRACLSLAGFTAGRTSGDLGEFLQDFGGGIDLTIFSA